MRLKRAVALFGVFLAAIPPASALTFGYKGLVSVWLFDNFERSSDTQLGGRFIPEFSLSQGLSDSLTLDAELSLNGYGTAELRSTADIQMEGEVKPYRFWLRLSSSRFEARLGLQKINFGSATLLRPLMWFDSLDPRDPLQLTDGVYGLLLRYYFQNNAKPNPAQIRFWLQELRTPQLLVEVAQSNAVLCRRLVVHRPLLADAAAGNVSALERALDEEEAAERERDKEYWSPLRAELEKLRRTK